MDWSLTSKLISQNITPNRKTLNLVSNNYLNGQSITDEIKNNCR